jgi:hypothetical protein
MADYTRGTGNGGIMLIRDQGWSVEFHIQAGLSSTWVGTPGFGTNAYVDGAWRGLPNVSNYSNRVWRYLGAHNATYNQDVCFHIDSSGTQGFGGPTDFWQYIHRATVPSAPTPIGLDSIGHTSMRYRFSGNSDGGSPIREWQIGYGTDPSNVQYLVGSSGTSDIGGLSIATTWYFWSRGRNDVGWGPWSSRSQARTLSSGRVKVAGTWREMVLYVKVAGVWRPAIIYNKVAGVWRSSTGN